MEQMNEMFLFSDVSAPENLSNIEIPFNTSELNLKWYQPGSADEFLVYVNNDSTHWSDVTLISQPSYANQTVHATVNNLPVPGGQYKISVVAQYQNVSSNHSTVQTFYTCGYFIIGFNDIQLFLHRFVNYCDVI